MLDTTSRGLCGLVCPPRTSESARAARTRLPPWSCETTKPSPRLRHPPAQTCSSARRSSPSARPLASSLRSGLISAPSPAAIVSHRSTPLTTRRGCTSGSSSRRGETGHRLKRSEVGQTTSLTSVLRNRDLSGRRRLRSGRLYAHGLPFRLVRAGSSVGLAPQNR